jgi:hypothetical protein
MEFNQTAIHKLRQNISQYREILQSQVLSIAKARTHLENLIWLANAEQTIKYIDDGITPQQLIEKCLDFCSSDGVRPSDPLAMSYRSAIVKSVINF